jgi:hypothetical protein
MALVVGELVPPSVVTHVQEPVLRLVLAVVTQLVVAIAQEHAEMPVYQRVGLPVVGIV